MSRDVTGTGTVAAWRWSSAIVRCGNIGCGFYAMTGVLPTSFGACSSNMQAVAVAVISQGVSIDCQGCGVCTKALEVLVEGVRH